MGGGGVVRVLGPVQSPSSSAGQGGWGGHLVPCRGFRGGPGGVLVCVQIVTSKWTPMIEDIGISSQYNSVTNTVTLYRILPSCSRRYKSTTNPARLSAAHRWTSDLCRRCVHCTHVDCSTYVPFQSRTSSFVRSVDNSPWHPCHPGPRPSESSHGNLGARAIPLVL